MVGSDLYILSMPLAETTAEPTVRVSRGWTGRFTLLWFGFWMAWLVPVQLVLPNQFAALDAAHKVRDFGIANGAAGVVALIALPVAGALCDRTRTRFGRRRVWMAAGVVVLALSLVAIGPQRSWVGVMVCWMFASLGFSIASAGLFAAVADQVPVTQRGIISGAIFGPQALGLLVGLALLAEVITGTASGYLVLAVAVVILSIPFVRRYVDSPIVGGRLPLTLSAVTDAMWVSPRAYPDFAWAFGGRVAVNIGNALGTTYLLYFFTNALHLKDPDTALLYVTAVYLVFTLLTTYGGGVLSDRSGRRRVLDLGPSALYPGHGPDMTEDPASVMRFYLDHRELRRRQILTILADGPADPPTLVRHIYRDTPVGLRPYAEQSTRAALHSMAREGVIELDASGVAAMREVA